MRISSWMFCAASDPHVILMVDNVRNLEVTRINFSGKNNYVILNGIVLAKM